MSTKGFLPNVNTGEVIKKFLVLNIIIYICIGFILPGYVFAAQSKYPYSKGKLNNYPGYEKLIQDMQKKHPNWNFTILDTGLDWNDVIKNETVASHGRNLVYYTDSGNWVCSICGNRTYDTGLWKCASEATVSYYMDPRNWMNESNIFQFENLAYNGDIQNIDGVNKILSSVKWASGDTITYIKTDGKTGTIKKTYAQVIMEAAKEAGISPYHLAARIKQEQGAGTTLSSTGRGDHATYKGYYNLLNIKATGADVIGNALKHAKEQGWDNPEKAIIGGAKFIASSYISRGQSTLYLQKFDVDNSDGSLFYHQYMQNVSAAYSEGNMVRSSYESMGLLDSSINFVIPVYNNMPAEASPSPAGTTLVTQNVEVKGTNVIVRDGRGTSAKEIAKVNKGDKLLRIETTGSQANGHYWDKVVLPDGRKGYIARDYLNKIDDITNAKISAIANTSVNLRNGPGTNDTRVITTLTSGQSLTIIEVGKYNGLDGYDWSRVKLSNGTQGYLASIYLTEVKETEYKIAYVNCSDTGTVNIRKGVGTDTAIITSLRKDAKVTVLQKSAGEANGYVWDKIVTADGLEGYIANNYLRYEEEKNNKPEENKDNNQTNNKASTNLCDVDGNNEVNSTDLFYVIKFLKENPNGYNEAYDVNKDKEVNSTDLYQIIVYLKQH
ncbi:MAG: SH3 domain-containing protein [Clostridia bacterium]|nr:SH3 domain-containing protein [Clostridia bacterium]